MMESLESRRMLSANLTSDGTLTILGTPASDRKISVRTYGAEGLIAVRVGNQPIQKFEYADIDRIVIDAGAGNDEVFLGGMLLPCTILGGAGNDTITGDSGDDYIHGGPGNDVFEFSNSRNTLIGGSGDDLFHTVGAFDTINGSTGTDTVECDNLDRVAGCESVDRVSLFQVNSLSDLGLTIQVKRNAGMVIAVMQFTATFWGGLISVAQAVRDGKTFTINVSSYRLNDTTPTAGSVTIERELGQLQAGNYTVILESPFGDPIVHPFRIP